MHETNIKSFVFHYKSFSKKPAVSITFYSKESYLGCVYIPSSDRNNISLRKENFVMNLRKEK